MPGGNVNHFNSVRLRVNGSGNLRLTFRSLDEVVQQTLVPMIMSTVTSIEPLRLCNFNTQRASLKVEVTDFDEYFSINRVTIFARPLFVDYPA